MASSYSTRLRVELIGTGEQDGSWGTTLNTQLGTILEEAIAGVASVTHDDTADYSLTTENGATDEARQMVLEIGGTLTEARNVVCPTQEKVYIVKNATSGGYDITIKTSGGTGITVPNGAYRLVYCDGTNVVAVSVPQGAGSGLDADTVDGVEAAALAALADNETVSGNWTFTGTLGAFSNAIIVTGQIESNAGNSTTANIYFLAEPTDYGTNKPYLAVQKSTTADQWNFVLWDGTDNGGTINFTVTNLTHNGNTIWTSANDGASSGLDADTLDGYEESALGRLAAARSWTAGQRGSISTLTDGATITPDMDDGNNFTVTLGGNRTLANPTNLTAGQCGSIFVVQDGTGSRTLAYGTYWDFAGGTAPTLSTGANDVDRIDYIVRSTTSIHAVWTGDLS